MRRTRGKRSVDYNLALPAFGWFLLFSIRLISCASTPYDAFPEISPLCRYFWSSLPTFVLIKDTCACVPDSLLWFFSFLLLFWSRCRSGLLCHECSVYSNLPVYSSACFLRFLMILARCLLSNYVFTLCVQINVGSRLFLKHVKDHFIRSKRRQKNLFIIHAQTTIQPLNNHTHTPKYHRPYFRSILFHS